jgi:hypothetical protein
VAPIKVSLINETTVLKDDQIKPVVDALQIQVSRDFAPIWGTDAELTFVPNGGDAVMDSWWLAFLDNADQAGALGYHDLTNLGFPLGKVFIKTDLESGSSWTNTTSHELLEILGDPYVNLTVLDFKGDGTRRLLAYENCDAVEDDSLGYTINDVLVSDFVTPDWFVPSSRIFPGVKYDFQEKVSSPFQILAGGYIGVYDLQSGAGWTQINAKGEFHRQADAAPVGSRRERRRTPRHHWKHSAVK